MEKRVELEMRGKKPEEVLQLRLDNCKASQLTGVTDEMKSLEFISLVNVGLTTLKGFPNLPSLIRLDLSDNRITGGLDNLSACPKICHLGLSGNKIKDVDTLEPLKTLEHLKSLDLFNCEVTSAETYRDKVFEMLPKLKYLDGFDKEDNPCDSDEDIYSGGDDDDDEDDEEEPGLRYLASEKALHDEDETEDYELSANNEGDDDEDDDDVDDEEDEEEAASGENGDRGTKRKLDDDASN